MIRLLERLLQLHTGDFFRGALLFLYLFLIIASYVVGKIARDTLFLAEFNAELLPFLDIFIAASVGFVVAAYLWLGRRTSLRNLQVGSLFLFSLIWLLLWWQSGRVEVFWLNALIYFWVGIFGVLAPMQVWMLANYTLTTREAKRVFGLVAFGATGGFLFASVFARVVAAYLGTESLLLAMAAFQLVCVGLVVAIWKRKPAHKEEGSRIPPDGGRALRVSLLQGLRLVLSTRYLQAISMVICVSSFVTTFAHWQFRATAQDYFGANEAALGIFFGNFYSVAAALCVVTQLLFTSRLLRRFGIGLTLFVVPIALLLGTAGLLVWGSMAAAVFLRGGDQVLRYSIDKSSVELLYLPVSARIKLQAKAIIDTIVWRLGDGLASVTLALFAFTFGWTVQNLSWINLALIALWFGAAAVARLQYVSALQGSIYDHRLDIERSHTQVLDRSTTEIIAGTLRSSDTEEVLYALGLFDLTAHPTPHPALAGLLRHDDSRVRARSLAILTASGDDSAQEIAEALLKDSALVVRTEALRYLSRHSDRDPLEQIEKAGDFEDYSVQAAIILYLARPGPGQNIDSARVLLQVMLAGTGSEGKLARLEAVRLLGLLPPRFSSELSQLLKDTDPEVVKQAVQAIGKQQDNGLIPELLEHLKRRENSVEVVAALAEFGDRVIPALREYLSSPDWSTDARIDILNVLSRIGTSEAERALAACVLNPDSGFRLSVISALNRLHTEHPALPLDRMLIETLLGAELLGHYRSLQIFESLKHDDFSPDAVQGGLDKSMEGEVERIFRLLSLLHPHHDFHSMHVALQSKDSHVHDNALELLDNILNPDIRKVLVPILDPNVSPAEKVVLANEYLGVEVRDRSEAVSALIHCEDPWLKSCGAYAIGIFGLHELQTELDACLSHTDPLLRTTAREARSRLLDDGSFEG